MDRAATTPAGAGEKLQYMVHTFNDNTIRFILHYPGLVDAGMLQAAAKAVVESVDILHSSFHPGRVSAYWEPHAQPQDYFELRRAEGDPVPQALQLALRPIAPEGSAQLRCSLVLGDESSAVAVAISHLCVDGSDGRYLLGKLAEAYHLLQTTGSSNGLSVKNGSRAVEQVYQTLSRQELRSLLKSPLSSIHSAFPYACSDEGAAACVTAHLPANVMTAARSRAKATGATANDLLIAAAYHAFAATPGTDPTGAMSILSMMDLRRHCRGGESEGLCNLSGSLPTELPNGVCSRFADTLECIASQTRALKADPLAGLTGMPILHTLARTVPMGLLLAAAGKVYGSMGLGLTNLGAIDCGPLALGGVKPDMGWFGGPLKRKPAMQVSAASFDGACSLMIAGQFAEADAGRLQAYLDHMKAELEAYAGED